MRCGEQYLECRARLGTLRSIKVSLRLLLREDCLVGEGLAQLGHVEGDALVDLDTHHGGVGVEQLRHAWQDGEGFFVVRR